MRKHAALHLVHYITEPDSLLWIGKPETSPGSGMAESGERGTQQ